MYFDGFMELIIALMTEPLCAGEGALGMKPFLTFCFPVLSLPFFHRLLFPSQFAPLILRSLAKSMSAPPKRSDGGREQCIVKMPRCEMTGRKMHHIPPTMKSRTNHTIPKLRLIC